MEKLSRLISTIHILVSNRGIGKLSDGIASLNPEKRRLWEISTSWILLLYAFLYFSAAVIGYFIATAENPDFTTSLRNRLIGYCIAPFIFFILAGILYGLLGHKSRLNLLRTSIVLNTATLCYLLLILGPNTGIQAFILPLFAIATLYFPTRLLAASLWVLFGLISTAVTYFWVLKHGPMLPLPSNLEKLALFSTIALLGISILVVIVALWWTKNVTTKLRNAWKLYWHLEATDYETMVSKRRRLKLTVAFSLRFVFQLTGIIILLTTQKSLSIPIILIIIFFVALNIAGAIIALKGYFEAPVSYVLVATDCFVIYSIMLVTGLWQSPFLPFIILTTIFSYILGDIFIGIFSTVLNSIVHFIVFAAAKNGLSLRSVFLSPPNWESIMIPIVLFGVAIGTIYVLRIIENLERELIIRNEAVNSALETSERLLLNILPAEIASELKINGHSDPRHFDSVTVMFTDFVGFTIIAEGMSPKELVTELDRCFSYFDTVTQKYNLEKIKTIGDSFMCAGGIPAANRTHVFDCALAAMEIQAFMNQMKTIKAEQGYPYWELRLGIHTGSLVAGVVGERKFAYDVWGDTVNTASRMESSGTPGKINISREAYDTLKFLFVTKYRGQIAAKNKGMIDMYYLQGIKPKFSIGGECRVPNENFRAIYDKIGNGARIVPKSAH